MELYIVRHGKTYWNEQKRTQGHVHNRLCKDGIEASKNTALKLKDVKFDYIFCSPLLRAKQTAKIINKYHNNKIIKDSRLIDIDQGYFTGVYYEKLSPELAQIKLNKDKRYGMESLHELYLRIKNFYDDLLKNYNNKKILIVTHSGVASFLQQVTKYNHFDKNLFNKTDLFNNAEVKIFKINTNI